MTIISGFFLLLGGFVSVLAGIGLLRFSTPYARAHAAGKASPIGFMIASIGVAIELPTAAGLLFFAAIAAALTMPIGVSFLFRAAYRNQQASLKEPAESEA